MRKKYPHLMLFIAVLIGQAAQQTTPLRRRLIDWASITR